MGRKKLYNTAEEKLAANRQKSKKYYEKSAEVINAERRKKYKHNKASSLGKEQKLVPRSQTDKNVVKAADSPQDKLAKKINFYMFKAENIKRLLTELTGNEPSQFADSVCLDFLETHEKDHIHKQVVKLDKLQRRIIQCQDKILQLAGVGEEWSILTKIVEEVRKITGWVEEIFCHAIVHHSEVERMYRNSEFAYQA